MLIYPLVRIERSLDGQIWREMSREDVIAVFTELRDLHPYQDRMRALTCELEKGGTVEIFPHQAANTFYLRGLPAARNSRAVA